MCTVPIDRPRSGDQGNLYIWRFTTCSGYLRRGRINIGIIWGPNCQQVISLQKCVFDYPHSQYAGSRVAGLGGRDRSPKDGVSWMRRFLSPASTGRHVVSRAPKWDNTYCEKTPPPALFLRCLVFCICTGRGVGEGICPGVVRKNAQPRSHRELPNVEPKKIWVDATPSPNGGSRVVANSSN